MALSGLIGAGAQAGLEDLLQRQMVEQQLQMRMQALAAEEENRRQALDIQRGQLDSIEKDRTERREAAAAAAKDKADKEAHTQTAQANMAELVNDPVQFEAFGTASGQLKPIDVMNLRQRRAEAAARETPAQKTARELREYEGKKQVDQKYPSPTAPRQPSFVQLPDGSVTDVMGVAPKGSVPYQRPVREKLTPSEAATHTRMLRSQYQREVATTKDVQRQADMMAAGMEAAKRGDLAAGSQAVLVTFQKILDPTSVVRESEYARSSAGQALLSRIEGAADRLARGGAGVPLGELQKFADLANAFVQNAVEREDAVRQHYVDMSTEFGLNPDLVVGKPAAGAGAGGATDAAPTHRWNPQTKRLEPVR